MNSFIKIKALSLGDEIARIRHEERKWLKQSRWCRRVLNGQVNRQVTVDPATTQAHALANFWGLRSHRLELRVEARIANLAYGFIRGRKYAQIENKVYTQPDWSKVVRLVEKYGEAYRGIDVKAAITTWRTS